MTVIIFPSQQTRRLLPRTRLCFLIAALTPLPGTDISGSSTPGKRGHQTDRLLTRVLQPPVPSTETEQGLAPHYRPECTQPLPVFPSLPHGDGTLSYAVPPAVGLVHLCQPEGRFPAHPHCTQAPQVPTLQDRGCCLSVPCTPFRLDHFSPRLHSHCQDSGGLRTFPGAQHVTQPGRLEHFSPVTHPLRAVDRMGPTPHCFPRTHPKPTQVRPDAISAVCVHWHSVRPEHWHGTPCPPQSGQLFMTAERLPVITGTPSGEVATPVGPHDFLGETDQAGASPHASCSVHAPRPMVTVIGPPSSSCVHYARASSGLTVVVSFSQPHLRSAPPPAPARPTPVHRRLQRGLGAHLLSHQTGGLWDSVQKCLHINILELVAVHLALQHFLPLVQGELVMVMTDNTTVVAQLRNRGGCC